MNLIWGTFQQSASQIIKEDLLKMRASSCPDLADQDRSHYDSHFGFGCLTQYNTQDSFEETLPHADSESGLVITADCRLDNKGELHSILGLTKPLTSSLLILEAFKKFGENCCQYLLGDFAFAIWDDINQCMHCFRDHIGIKPLFYTEISEKFYFATNPLSLTCLRAHNEISKEAFIQEMSGQSFLPNEETIYRNIKILLPGHYLKISQTGLQIRQYWKLSPQQDQNNRHKIDYANELNELLHQAIKCRLESRYPVASHLTGGLDSSLISVLANRLSAPSKVLGISWSPKVNDLDNTSPLSEVNRIEKILNAENINCKFYDQNNYILKKDFIHFIRLPNENQTGPTVAKSNIRTLLSGWGGDEFASFNGKDYYVEMITKLRWLSLIKHLGHDSRNLRHFLILVKRHILAPFWPRFFDSDIRQFSKEKLKRIYGMEFDNVDDLNHKLKYHSKKSFYSSKQHRIQLFHDYHLQDRIEEWNLKSYFHKFEYRYPLLDKRIVEFCMSIPSEILFENNKPRSLFLHIAQECLPFDVFEMKFKSEPSFRGFNQQHNSAAYLDRSSFESLFAGLFYDKYSDYL